MIAWGEVFAAAAGLFRRPNPLPLPAPTRGDDEPTVLRVAPYANRQAMVTTISACEGTDAPNGYRYLFGSSKAHEKLFDSFDDHPRVRTYETHDEFIHNGKVDYTTAAGRFQITATTYDRLWNKPTWLSRQKPAKRCFTAEAQDMLAIELIAEAHALGDVDDGKVEAAVAKLGGLWASLPSATVGQPKRDRNFVINTYVEAGGAYVAA